MIRNFKRFMSGTLLLASLLLGGGMLANADSPIVHVIDLKQAIDNSPSGTTITLSQDLDFTDAGDTITIPADKEITLDGARHIIDAKDLARVVENYGKLTLKNITLMNGNKNVGAGLLNEGELFCENVRVHQCKASQDGGGIYNKKTLHLSDSILSNNQSNGRGGGVWNFTGSELTAEHSVFLNNTSTIYGGAMFCNENTKTIITGGSTFHGNLSSTGGGIYLSSSLEASIQDTIFEKNVAKTTGGSFYILNFSAGIFEGGNANISIDLSTVRIKNNLSKPSVTDPLSLSEDEFSKVTSLNLTDARSVTNVNEFTFLRGTAGSNVLGKVYVLAGRNDLEPIGLQNISQHSDIAYWQTDKGEKVLPNDLVSYLKAQTDDKTFYAHSVEPITPTPGENGGSTTSPTKPSTTEKVLAAKVTISGKKVVAVKKSIQLKATVTPTNATNKTITWSTSNKKIATVDKNGKVTAKKAGVVIITAKTNNKKTATFRVTVTDKHTKKKSIKVKKGQSLVKIAKQLKIKDWRNLWSWNDKIKTPNRLPKAQKLVYYVFK